MLELLSGHTLSEVDDIAANQELSEPLHKFDQDDFHVWSGRLPRPPLRRTAPRPRRPAPIGVPHRRGPAGA